jgi:hypothetical protein
LKSGISDQTNRITAFETAIKGHTDQIGGFGSLLKDLKSQMTEMSSQLTGMDTQMSKMVPQVSDVHTKVAQVDTTPLKNLSSAVVRLRADVGTLKDRTSAWDSLIAIQLPPLFEEFRRKCFNLLWRGSRDGFTAREFHRRCDGRANTLTLILDTDGNVFGGFTPVEWETPASGKSKGDDSLQSFLFTLRNPHGDPPRTLALREEKKGDAIYCHSAWCAVFSGGIVVWDKCNTKRDSWTRIGRKWSDMVYENDTRFEYFFTGAEEFTVKEIEVFEMND